MVLVGHILDCHYYKFKKILANNKARQFVFKKPHLGSTNFKTLPLIEKNKFLRSIRQNCSKNSVRVAKLFRLRMVDAISELRYYAVCTLNIFICDVFTNFFPIGIFRHI